MTQTRLSSLLEAVFNVAVGFVVILYFSAQHVGFTPPQWAALIAATVGLAGLCAWIINWE